MSSKCLLAHPQNHHPDGKVVNSQFFAGLAAVGCTPFGLALLLAPAKSALQAVFQPSPLPKPALEAIAAHRAC